MVQDVGSGSVVAREERGSYRTAPVPTENTFNIQLSDSEWRNWPASLHTAGHTGICGHTSPESPVPYPQNPPWVPTVLPTVGPLDYPLTDYSRNPFEVRCVVHRVLSSLLGPVDPSFRALSGRLKFTVQRHKFNIDSLSCGADGRVFAGEE